MACGRPSKTSHQRIMGGRYGQIFNFRYVLLICTFSPCYEDPNKQKPLQNKFYATKRGKLGSFQIAVCELTFLLRFVGGNLASLTRFGEIIIHQYFDFRECCCLFCFFFIAFPLLLLSISQKTEARMKKCDLPRLSSGICILVDHQKPYIKALLAGDMEI